MYFGMLCGKFVDLKCLGSKFMFLGGVFFCVFQLCLFKSFCYEDDYDEELDDFIDYDDEEDEYGGGLCYDYVFDGFLDMEVGLDDIDSEECMVERIVK